jgi:dihydroneopterin aldolase
MGGRAVTAADAAPDRVALLGLSVRGYHGVFEHERANGQDFLVDVVLGLDTAPAARSDDLVDTVDYGALAQTVAGIVAGEPVNLLETLAGRIAAACLTDPKVASVEVSVHKPQAPILLTFRDVVVTVTRSR